MLKEQNFTIASNAKRIISFGIDELLMSFLFTAKSYSALQAKKQ